MSTDNFIFNTTSGIRFGSGMSKLCAEEVSKKLGTNILFITDKDLMSLKLTEPTLNELKKLSSNNNDNLNRAGLWFFSRHPDLLGQLISWWGLYLLALGAYGGEWSIFGPLLVTFLYLRNFLLELEERLARKYNDYNEYKLSTPGIFPKVSFLKS